MSCIVDFCSRDFGDTRRVMTGRWRAVQGTGGLWLDAGERGRDAEIRGDKMYLCRRNIEM